MKKLFVKDILNKIEEIVELYGWIDAKRDHKKIVFVDLRDRTGVVQVVGNEKFKALSGEDVVYIKGKVKERPKDLINPKITTGKIEIEVKEFKILGKSTALPIPVNSDGYEIDEEMRLKYRYLDLRRSRMIRNLTFRSKFIEEIRQELFKKNFVEIETPYISSPTPEGARDFLIPSRLQKGKFYALPQSPQQYKQLLMVAGLERYFQIARCFRDEDPRADRAYGEFTQLDMEMSFVNREDVMKTTEDMVIKVYEKLKIPIKEKPFPIYTYQEAIKKFGADKFDIRNDKDKKNNVQAFAWVVDFPFFEKTDEGGWTFTHNPFSAPLPQYKEDLLKKKNIDKILTSQYDLVCNGLEVGGGSIRSHEGKTLETVFEIMGYKTEEIWEQFGHMLEAFSYGAPPHGGIAPGLDRLIKCIFDEPSLREVMAFPMTSGGQTAVMKAPVTVKPKQLEELSIKTTVTNDHQKESVFLRIKSLLDTNNLKYKVIKHLPVNSSVEAAKVRGSSLKIGAKALVMSTNNKTIMLVLPADRKVDMEKFKQHLKISKLHLAKPEEVKKFTGVEIGAVPPFGNLFNLDLYVDKKILENEQIIFNAGLHDKSIEMKSKDFIMLTQPILSEFSV